MKSFALFAAVVSLVFLAACGGGGPANPGTGASGFSNASFSGNYVFTITGECTGVCSSAAIAQGVGLMVADGKGNISGGYLDLNIGGGDQTTPLSGTYSVSSDGTASLTLSGSTFGFSNSYYMMLTGTNGGYIVSADAAWALSGVVEQQSTAAIGTQPTGNFVFRASGTDSALNSLGIVGAMNLTSGAVNADMNSNGTQILLGTGSISANTYDNTTGRGSLTISTTSSLPSLTFVYYVVDANTLELVSNDAVNGLQGRAELSGGVVPNGSVLSGSFAFLGSGYPPTGIVQVSEGGVFTGNGAGGITSGVIDTVFDNNNPSVGATLSGTGTVSTVGGVTRDVLTLSPGASIAMKNAALWLTSAGRGFYLTTMADRAETGTITAQSGGPFTDNGTYGFHQSGFLIQNGSWEALSYATLFKNSSGKISGYSQAMNLGGTPSTTTNNGTLSFDATGTIGTLTLNNTYIGTEVLRFYQYSPGSAFIMEVDGGGAIASGQMSVQTAQ
jgi:hypothetical protein